MVVFSFFVGIFFIIGSIVMWFRQKDKGVRAFWIFIFGILLMIYGYSAPGGIKESMNPPKPGDGVKIVTTDANEKQWMEGIIKESGTKGIPDSKLKEIGDGMTSKEIDSTLGEHGILTANYRYTTNDGYVHVDMVMDYPSADHQGQKKVVVIEESVTDLYGDINAGTVSTKLEPISWQPTQLNPNYVIKVDDTGATYY